MTTVTAKEIVKELIRRMDGGDDTAIDDLIAEDMVNHAAAPQGRAGWKYILEVIDHDLADVTYELLDDEEHHPNQTAGRGPWFRTRRAEVGAHAAI